MKIKMVILGAKHGHSERHFEFFAFFKTIIMFFFISYRYNPRNLIHEILNTFFIFYQDKYLIKLKIKMVILRGKAWSFWEAWLVFGFSNKIIVKFLFPIVTIRGILFINNTSYYCRMQLSSLYSKILIKSWKTSTFLIKILMQDLKFNLRAAIFLDFRLQEVLICLLAITVTRKRLVNSV